MPYRRTAQTLLCLLLLAWAGAISAKDISLGLVLSDDKDRKLDAEILNETTEAFFKSRRFKLAERAELDAVIQEKGLQDFIGALNGDNAAAGLEKLTGLDMIGLVTYSVERLTGSLSRYWISVRLVSVASGDILDTVDSRREGLSEPTTPHVAGENLFQNVRELFPPQGYIVRINGSEAVVDLGTEVGLKEGDTLEVFKEGDIILHPVTGKPLPGEEIVLGTLKVTRVSSQISTCKMKGSAGGLGAQVRLKPKDQRFFKALNIFKKNSRD